MEERHRSPRFQRTTKPPAIRLTERDTQIVRRVHAHRFLRSDHIAALLNASLQPILRRLHLLYHHGYLDRPKAQLDYFQHGGSARMVYGLGNRGAELLQQHFGMPRPRKDWTSKNQSVKSVFLQHALAVADVLVRLECACRNNPLVQFIAPEEMARQRQSSVPGPRFEWPVSLRFNDGRQSIGVIPDAVFALKYPARPPDRNTTCFFLEADRGTMPVRRSSPHRTSFLQKMGAYYETWRQQLTDELFHVRRCRVLTVTTTPERAQHILSANRCFNDGKGSGIFLVTDSVTLSQHDNVLTLPLPSGRVGQTSRLLDG